jgi:hypothetical protein
MTTPRAALHVAPESEGSAHERLSDLARDQDPLRRLEAELQSADGGRAEVERLYEKTWGLLEEAWSLMTECLVMRDGLLDACREIEQTMGAIHSRLGMLSVSVEPNAHERLPASELDAANGSDNALAP